MSRKTHHHTIIGAESLMATLVASGVEVCFANPGTSEMHFVSALDRVTGMRGVLCLFEGVATGAADGYARMAGKPAATLLHLGPGLANGLANLHNARRAQSAVVNVIGDHATTHLRFDAPLTSDVVAIARPVSNWVVYAKDSASVATVGARAVQAARTAPGQIASLILPADAAWSPAPGAASPLEVHGPKPVPDVMFAKAAAAIRAGRSALLMRGEVLRERGLLAAGRIAAATGTRLLCDTFAPRIERGAGRVVVERLPYRGAATTATLQGLDTLILVGAAAPVAFFAYPDQPGDLVPPGCTVVALARPHEDGVAALEALASAVAAGNAAPLAAAERPALPADGALDARTIMQVVGHHLPDHSIIVDESVTGGFSQFRQLDTAAPHDVLRLSGGAIGEGLPLATGAAIACPGRRVITMQADGSAMYTLQALWTQAREKLDVTTIIYANRSYRILIDELRAVGAQAAAEKTLAMFDLGNPILDWVKLAEGMGVEAVRVDGSRALADAARSAFVSRGPRLIEAVM